MNWILVAAALSGALAVAAGGLRAPRAGGAGAGGAEAGAHYQLVHAIAAIAILRLDAKGPAWLFLTGGAIFAGTLYLMALGLPRWLGAITPIGGALLIAAWLWLAWIGARQ